MTYGELVHSIADFLETDEETFVTHVDDFIRSAENRIYSAITTPDCRGYSAQGRVPPTDPSTIETPANCLRPLDLIVAGVYGSMQPPLLLKEPSFIHEAYPGGATGAPKFYAIYGSGTIRAGSTLLQVAPSPPFPADYILHYFGHPTVTPTLDDISGATGIDEKETWLSHHAPEALLYESLVEGYTYQKGAGSQDGNSMLEVYKFRAGEAQAQLRRLVEGLQKVDQFRNPEPKALAT
jgi:hypothetical protein